MEKKTEIEYELSYDEYMEIQTYFMLRKTNIVIFCAALFALGLILGIVKLATGSGVSGVWVLVIFPFPYLVYVIFKIRNIAYRMYPGDIKDWKFIFDENGFTANAILQKKNFEASWNSIYKVWKTRKYIFFFMSKDIYFVIPVRAFEDAEILNQCILRAKSK